MVANPIPSPFFLILALGLFYAPAVFAQEADQTISGHATTTPETIATTTQESATTVSTSSPQMAQEIATTTVATGTPPQATTTEISQGPTLGTEPKRSDLSSSAQSEPTIIEKIVEIVKEVPVYVQERAFDPATAPGKVHLSVLMPDHTPPTVSVYVSFIGVGGKTFGGPLDKEGNITVTMPQGRYYTEFLVIDTRYGPPNDPPSFFLDPNEEQTFGPLILSTTSSFTDTALEAEVDKTLSEEKGGMAKILSLIVKLLLAILHEIRSLRSEMVSIVHPHFLFS